MGLRFGLSWRTLRSIISIWWAGITLVLLAWPGQPVWAQQGDGQPLQVIVVLWAPSISADIYAQEQVVAQAQADVLASVSAADFQPTYRYQLVPGIAGTVSAQGLARLQQLPQVRAVAFDLPVEAALGESSRVIGADRVWSELGVTGAGVTMAVLDSGVDLNHPDLSGHIVGQHCFNHGTCPPGNTDQGDSAMDQHGHGTHVAGIISSRGTASPRGIAPGTSIVAVRVLNNTGSGWTSDVVAGIDWVVANQSRFNIKILNLSLGGGAYSGPCDGADANAMLYASAIQAARQLGMTIFAASGNGGLTNQIMTPACITGVIAVASTYDSNLGSFTWGNPASPLCVDADARLDQVTCTSNSSSELDLLAPGAWITAAALGGGQSNKSGTSMATPHASAVAALMLEAQPGLTPPDIENILKETGVPVTDARTGRVTPRIDAYAAVTRVRGSPSPAALSGRVLLQGRNSHDGTSISLTQQACTQATSTDAAANPATSKADLLGVASVASVASTDVQGHFEISTAPGQGVQCLQATHPGFLPAQHNAPAGDLGTITLAGGDVIGDGAINIYDMAFLANHYGGSDPVCDLNGDGHVDIFDLVIAAGNYGRQGPSTDWR